LKLVNRYCILKLNAATSAISLAAFGWQMQAMGPATMIDTGAGSGTQGHITSLGASESKSL
jgi:hypothetical protein